MDGDRDKFLKIVLGNQLSALSFLLVLLVIILLFIIWLYYNHSDPVFIQFMFAACIIGFGLNTFPVLFLHYTYWQANKGEVYQILFDRLVRWREGNREEILGSDIEKITVHLCPSMYQKSNLHFLGIEAYYYARVDLKNGNHFFLTCLLHPKLDDILTELKGVRIYRKKTYFPSMK